MARLRVGILDVTAVIVVAVAIFLPPRSSRVASGLEHELLPKDLDLEAVREDIATLEGRLAADPTDAEAAERLANNLIELGHHDQALRVAGAAASIESPDRWRAYLALSAVRAERIEIEAAHAAARSALDACGAPDTTCQAHQRVRLSLYYDELEAGMKALESGADPRADPDAFRDELNKVHPTARMRGVSP